ncbi:cytochrome c biogenesis protein ResB [Brevibacterium sp.]|nr:cytochrome c biogenesis protein ResB [Brevibacterium sp.]
MRAALILLLMLALAIIPASLLPQRIQDPARVASFIEDNGQWGEVLDTFQLFDVHSSVWFASIYILLMVSLVGCILPRTRQHLRAMRQEPPKAPRRLTRMPGYASFGPPLGTSSKELLDAAERLLKKRGYRTVRHPDHIAAERVYLRETGNLVNRPGSVRGLQVPCRRSPARSGGDGRCPRARRVGSCRSRRGDVGG